jgi:hypothetical protein
MDRVKGVGACSPLMTDQESLPNQSKPAPLDQPELGGDIR